MMVHYRGCVKHAFCEEAMVDWGKRHRSANIGSCSLPSMLEHLLTGQGAFASRVFVRVGGASGSRSVLSASQYVANIY